MKVLEAHPNPTNTESSEIMDALVPRRKEMISQLWNNNFITIGFVAKNFFTA